MKTSAIHAPFEVAVSSLIIIDYRCYGFLFAVSLLSVQHNFCGADVRSAGILFSCFALVALMVTYFLAAIVPADPVISFWPETFKERTRS